MAEQIRPGLVEAEGEATPMGLDEDFKFIGKLARQAGQGDEAAGLMLEILNNQQLAEIQNLKLELELLNAQAVARATLSFMALPE